MTRLALPVSTLPVSALLLAIACPAAAQVGQIQNLDALERRLVISLGADIGEPGGPATQIDRRMKLAACPGPVKVEPPLSGAAVLRCQEIGWRIRVPLIPGGVEQPRGGGVQPVAMQRPAKVAPVIRRGDPVEIRSGRRGFSVSQQMIADQDGAPGDRIRVRADARSTPVMVEVVDAGLVRVPGI